MDPLKNRLDTLDIGLEGILTTGGPVTLPSPQGFKPRGEPLPKRLDALWRTDSLSQRIRVFVRPRISDQEMLSPLAYENRLRQCLNDLTTAEDHASPEIEALQRALSREIELRGLLSTYRSLLLQA